MYNRILYMSCVDKSIIRGGLITFLTLGYFNIAEMVRSKECTKFF
ncbi:hypothetical protein RIR_e38438_A0A2I1GV33_9GLOM [Rhizophagus irregularis DAOM 181602=DAOM 197198]|nr:hypothetical protein RIR_e38438_A0A2I1GV33_9GLOM [Rhizophagus irregularis DAOM 181602=DAOM 197198]